MDEPRACYTEWSKSEREEQISYINAYIENLEGRISSQSSNGDAAIENRLMDKGGGEEREMNGDSSMDTYTLTQVK